MSRQISKSDLFFAKGGERVLYQNVLALCLKKGINIYKLEQETGLGNATVRGWVSSSPRIETLKKVADYFGVTIDELLSERNETEKKKEGVIS